jgi:hypothetical protein
MRVHAIRRANQGWYEHPAVDRYLSCLDRLAFRQVVAGGYAQVSVFGAWILAVFAWISLGQPGLPALVVRFGPAGLGLVMVTAGLIGANRANQLLATNRLQRWLALTMSLLMYPITAGFLVAGLLAAVAR